MAFTSGFQSPKEIRSGIFQFQSTEDVFHCTELCGGILTTSLLLLGKFYCNRNNDNDQYYNSDDCNDQRQL
jgi:hypothetical protein